MKRRTGADSRREPRDNPMPTRPAVFVPDNHTTETAGYRCTVCGSRGFVDAQGWCSGCVNDDVTEEAS